MAKSADAFRTISEVAEWLGVQTHVLRFWESKFSQVRPVKRAGGRRYYRPADMLLLGGIRKLLHEDGLTIKGVQKVLREEGVPYVADLSQPLDALTTAEIDEDLAPGSAPEKVESAQAELPLQSFMPAPANPSAPPPIIAEAVEPAVPTSTNVQVDQVADTASEPMPSQEVPIAREPVETVPPASDPSTPVVPDEPEPEPESLQASETTPVPTPDDTITPEPEAPDVHAPEPGPVVETPAEAAPPESGPAPEAPAPVPHRIEAPDGPPHDEIHVNPGLLSRMTAAPHIDDNARAALPSLRSQLAQLRDRMTNTAPPQA